MIKRLTIMSALLATICSCNREQITALPGSEGNAVLTVEGIDVASTKALHTDATLTGSFGAMLAEPGKSTYDGLAYENVRFTSSGSGNAVAWTPERSILLSTTSGTLYSYYPYSADVTDMNSIAVQATSSVQTDYMYGTPVSGLNNRNASAVITMNHALAAVNIAVVKGTYTGAGAVTKVSVKGAAIATSADLDATTGTLSGFAGQNTEIAPAASFTISGTAQNNNIIVIPTGESKAITITVTIDGTAFTATTSAADLPEGTITKYTVTANSESLDVTKVNVTPWADANGENLNLNV